MTTKTRIKPAAPPTRTATVCRVVAALAIAALASSVPAQAASGGPDECTLTSTATPGKSAGTLVSSCNMFVAGADLGKMADTEVFLKADVATLKEKLAELTKSVLPPSQ